MDALEIRLRLNKSHAEKEAAAFHAAEKKRAAETAKTQADATREAERVAREALRQRTAEERKAAQERSRIDNRELTEAEIRERAKAGIYRKTNQQRIEEYIKAHRTEIDLGRQSQAALASAKNVLTSFAGQMFGLSGVSSVVNEVAAGFQRVRDSIFNGTEMMREFRETLLELAALKDRLGDTSAESIDVLRVQAQTGQKRQDVVGLQTGFLGMAESMVGEGDGKKISAAEAQKAMIFLGRMQAVQGADAGSYGELGGMILQNAAKPMTGEEVAKEAAAAYGLFQPGRFDSFGQFIDMFGKSSPFVGSGVMSGRQAMALTSAFSIPRGDEAATAVRQFLQATTGSQGAGRTVKGIDPIAENIAAGQYLADLGLKDVVNPIEIGKGVAADVDRAEAASKAAGKEFNPIEYLRSRGYGNQESVLSLLDFRGSLKTGTWGEFEKLANDPNLGQGVRAEADRALVNDPGLQARQAQASSEISDMLPGMGKPEIMRVIREAARSRLIAQQKGKPGFGGISSIKDLETAWAFDIPKQIEMSMVQGAASSMLMEFADREGIGYKATHGMGGSTYLSDDEQLRVYQELGARGVNVPGEVNAALAKAAEDLQASAGMLRNSVGAPPPLQGAPRQPPAAAR